MAIDKLLVEFDVTHSYLIVRFDVVNAVRAPLVVQFDVEPVPGGIDALAVQFDVVEAVGDPLEVAFDVVQASLVASRLNDDIQAPVARVTLT